MRRTLVLVTAALFLAGALPGRAATTGETCADPNARPGEWRMYGHDLSNSRNQPEEDVINASTVGNIAASWTFNAEDVNQAGILGGGSFQNTPVIADGCVYLASSTGVVFALNADTGKRVWTSIKMPGRIAGDLQGGVITGSPVVQDGKVYVGVATYYEGPPELDANGNIVKPNGPFVAALDQATGEVLWFSTVMDPAKAKPEYETTIVSAPVIVNGLIFQGIMASESTPGARGGYAILDAQTGERILQDWTISDAEYKAGFRGSSIWCTGAADPETNHVYACGGNPASKRVEHRYSNALLKIDMDPTRPTFGAIVDSYKGTPDNYYPGLERQPVCEMFGEEIAFVWSFACLQLDLDFGASPHLYKIDVGGEPVTMLGDVQKSGIYHALFADEMGLAWSTLVGGPCVACNAASPAVANGQVFVAGTPPAQIVALTADRGRYQWASPVISAPNHFQSTSTANGVVYTMTAAGELLALDAATGLPMLRRNLALDVGTFAGDTSSNGVAIARNTVYAASGSYIVAYR